jgi:hypothetical protein
MPTAYRRLAEVRRNRRLTVIAGRPATGPAGNPWADAAAEERLRAAAFADRVVLGVCIAIGAVILASYVAPDLAAWIAGEPVVVVAR